MLRDVNRELLIIKGLYFFELSAISCLYIYLTPFMYEYGATASEIAIINFVGHISSLFGRPIIGTIADKKQKYREIIVILACLCTFMNTVQLATPKHFSSANSSIPKNYFLTENYGNSTKYTMCFATSATVSCWPSMTNDCLYNSVPKILNQYTLVPSTVLCSAFPVFGFNKPPELTNLTSRCLDFFQHCSESRISDLIRKQRDVGFTWSLTFWLFVLFEIFGHSLFSCLHNLTDALTFVSLDNEKSHNFGFTRVFGTLGILMFSIITAITLYFFDLFSKNGESKLVKELMSISEYLPCFILSFIVYMFVIVIGMFLKNKKAVRSKSSLKYLCTLLRNFEISIFLIFSFLGGFTYSVLIEYYFLIMIHIYTDLPKYFPGIAHSVMTLSEVIFTGASPLILKYMNEDFWISFSFCMWGIKWLSYLFVSNYWLLLIIELFHGPSYGLMLMTMMSYVSKFANETTQARIQSLFSSLFFNIGGALGGLYGGTILDKFGHRVIFASMSTLCFVCGISYYLLLQPVVRGNCRKKNQYFTQEKEIFLLDLEKHEVYI